MVQEGGKEQKDYSKSKFDVRRRHKGQSQRNIIQDDMEEEIKDPVVNKSHHDIHQLNEDSDDYLEKLQLIKPVRNKHIERLKK